MRTFRALLVLSVLLCPFRPLQAQTQDSPNRTERLSEIHILLLEDRVAEGFSKLIDIPGAEYRAAYFGRRFPEEALRILDAREATAKNPRLSGARGDVLLALGRRKEALECWRKYARVFEHANGYPVEPTPLLSEFDDNWMRYPLMPDEIVFEYGSGGHTDNLLIRRFLALDAHDDAGREFSRMWRLHQSLVGTRQYPFRSLEFVIDYAYFLKRTNRTNDALKLVLSAFERIDLDHVPVPLPDETKAAKRLLSKRANGCDFIRLAYEFFKSQGREAELIASVTKAIESGNRAARRTLAQLLTVRGDLDAALREELAHVDSLAVGVLVRTYRRGLVFDLFDKKREALREYEACLALPESPSELIELPNGTGRSVIFFFRPTMTLQDRAGELRRELLDRLCRLYADFGELDKSLTVALMMLDWNPPRGPEQIESLEKAFREAGRHDEFIAAVKQAAKNSENAGWKVDLARYVGDQEAYLNALAGWAQHRRRFGVDGGVGTAFSSVKFKDAEWERLTLECLAREFPRNGMLAVRLLGLNVKQLTPETIPACETVLDRLKGHEFRNLKFGSTQFKDSFAFGLQLMRLYEETGDQAKMFALALRTAKCESPFSVQGAKENASKSPSSGDQLLTVALRKLTDPAQLAALGEALDASPWTIAARQLRRRLGKSLFEPRPEGGETESADAAMKAVVSHNDVLSLCRDETRLFVGHPWGVAIRDFKGNLIRNVLLGDAALTMVAAEGALWVGMNDGVRRVDLDTFEQSRFPCTWDSSGRSVNDGVRALAAQAGRLWIATEHGLRVLDMRTGAVRLFIEDEISLWSSYLVDWKNLLIDGDFVWIDGNKGCLRYDPKTDRLDAPEGDFSRPIHLIGLIDGKLWGSVRLQGKRGARPCLIDRDTLAVTVFQTEWDRREATGREVHELNFFGHWKGNPVFGESNPLYVLDLKTRIAAELKLPKSGDESRIDSDIPFGLQAGARFDRNDGVTRFVGRYYSVSEVPLVAESWHMLKLPNGTSVFGGRRQIPFLYEFPSRESEFLKFQFGNQPEPGGLWLVFPDSKTPLRASSDLRGDVVFFAAPHEPTGTMWLATSDGLVVMNAKREIVGTFDRSDGLAGNQVVGGFWSGDKFVCGGLAGITVLDSKTAVVTNPEPFRNPEGNRIRSISFSKSRNRVDIVFDSNPVQSATFSPETETFSVPAETKEIPAEQPVESEAKPEPMPHLGGFVTRRIRALGRTWLLGTRGMLVFDGDLPPAPTPREIKTFPSPGQRRLQWEEARNTPIARPGRPDLYKDYFEAFVTGTNPYLAVKTLEVFRVTIHAGTRPYLESTMKLVRHPNALIREKAVEILADINKETVVAALRTAVHDENRMVRLRATSALVKFGIVEDTRPLIELFNGVSEILFRQSDAAKLLATVADAEIIRLMAANDDFVRSGNEDVYRVLGERLKHNPKLLDALWSPHPLSNSETGGRFTRRVLKYVGATALPKLHDALQSPNRNARLDAARICGDIGDSSSIPHLIRALGVNDNPFRVVIAEALGTLKAVESVPELARLYEEVRKKERLRSTFRVRYPHKLSDFPRDYVDLIDLDAVGDEWADLKIVLQPVHSAFGRPEPVLSSEFIRQTVKKIGNDHEQTFYRLLAGSKNGFLRAEACELLSAAPETERTKNRLVLLGLLKDRFEDVQVAAAVSLLILGETTVEPMLSDWLGKDFDTTFRQLQRVNPNRLEFAREALEKRLRNITLEEFQKRDIRNLLPRNP